MNRSQIATVLLMFITGCTGISIAPVPANPSLQPGQLLLNPVSVGDITPDKIYNFKAFGQRYVGSLAPSPVCSVTTQRLVYETTGVNGEPASASAVLLLPFGDEPQCQQPLDIISYSRGTYTKKNRIMSDINDDNAKRLAAFFAGSGAAVVSSDYLGFGYSDYPFSPYIHSKTEASSGLDAIKAAKAAILQQDRAVSNKLFIHGHSQGAHASLALQQRIQGDSALMTEYDLIGASSSSPPAALRAMGEQMLAYDNPSQLGHLILTDMIASYQRIYGDMYDQPSQVWLAPLDQKVQGLFPGQLNLNRLLNDKVIPFEGPYKQLENIALTFQKHYRDKIVNGDTSDPYLLNFQKHANENDFILNGFEPSVPTLVCAGSKDTFIPFVEATKPLVDKWRDNAYVKFVDVDPLVDPLAKKVWDGRGFGILFRFFDIKTYDDLKTLGYHWLFVNQLCMAQSVAWYQQHR